MRKRRVLAIVPDLFFATRIAETSKRLGVDLITATAERALEVCRTDPPDLVIVDLAAAGVPADLVREIKLDPALAASQVVAFYPHVEVELRRRALAAGVDQVLPRSVFTARLAALLSGERRSTP